MSGDRSAEIWSTRLQRELLSLSSSSTEGKVANETSDGKEATPNANDDIGLLPPFVTLKEHSLDIVKATCLVTFQIEVGTPPSSKTKSKTSETSETEKALSNKEEEEKEESKQDDDSEKVETDADREVVSKETSEPRYVLVSFDASMRVNSKGEIISHANVYPFEKPKASLKSGAEFFPKGSDISNGDEIEVTCDWTPSLHLSDAALNVSLTIRESIIRGELYNKVKPKAMSREENTIDALLRKFTIPASNKSSRTKKSSKSKPKRGKNETLRIGDVIELNEPPYNICAGMYSCKAIRRPQFMETDIVKFHASSNPGGNYTEDDEDENEIPQGFGNYMKLQAGGIRKVAGTGIMGTKSMLKSFISTAKSAMEDSFLMITDTYIIELRSSKFNIGTATVTYAIPVSQLGKLKFRRQESISLFFKQVPDDPLIFMCPDSADAVQQIQNVLKRHGVKGKHTNAATQRAIQSALNLVAEIQQKERDLNDDPSVENVDRIMSLYRQAAERFESAGDIRHEEVMNHMRKFLKKPRIISILDGSFSRTSSPDKTPQGEILEPIPSQYHHDSDDDVANTPQKFDVDIDEEKMNAHNERAESFDMDDDLDDYLANSETPLKKDEKPIDHDPVAELDAMFNAADKELADILAS